jgi:hypothetical protein
VLKLLLYSLKDIQNKDCRDHMVVKFTLSVQSVPITTKVVSSNPADGGEVYSIQHYVIKIISDLRCLSL